MNFKEAIQLLNDGKKVRRPTWQKDSYWILGKDKVILWNNKEKAGVHLNQINAEDWERYEEGKTLANNIIGIGERTEVQGVYQVIKIEYIKKLLKEFIEDSIAKIKDLREDDESPMWYKVGEVIQKEAKEKFGKELYEGF